MTLSSIVVVVVVLFFYSSFSFVRSSTPRFASHYLRRAARHNEWTRQQQRVCSLTRPTLKRSQDAPPEEETKKKEREEDDDDDDDDDGFKVHKKSDKKLVGGKVVDTLEDQTLSCRETAPEEFVFTSGEQEFYASKGWENKPTRCEACKRAKKARFGEDKKTEVLRVRTRRVHERRKG